MSKCSCEESLHSSERQSSWWNEYQPYFWASFSAILLLSGICLEMFRPDLFKKELQWIVYGVAYYIVGKPVVWKAVKKLFTADLFNEFFLMSLATIGAFVIGEYAEGVAVMLFYTVGELFQEAAVNRAKRSIESLLKLQVEEVQVLEDGKSFVKHPKDVQPGQIIQVKSGEKVALDGVLFNKHASFNTAALTGESLPVDKEKGDEVLAGMINLHMLAEIKVSRKYEDSKLSQILNLVQEATSRKAKAQRFITRFAKVYTPVVVFLAVGLTLFPWFFVENYVFNDWLYKSLIFLVISCPCALVISIPLGYFGGIGAASKNGILFKGSNFLDQITRIDTVVMDKTGTLTKGVFEVQDVVADNLEKNDFVQMVAALEAHSNHPIAQAIVKYAGDTFKELSIAEVEEIPGHGLKGKINDNQTILAGNEKLLYKFNIPFDEKLSMLSDTTVLVAINGKFAGYIIIADTLKEDAKIAIKALYDAKIKTLVMLSGDKQIVVDRIADQLGLDKAVGGLLPEDKVKEVERLKEEGRLIAFVGDGINDAPVVTVADVGMAMGGLGSDAAIEAADVVIQTDQPSKIVTAVKVGHVTKRIVWQNIGLAFGVKLIVLILGAGGIATMWEAVFADVGVALLAIFNAMRIQNFKFVQM
ncbi:heavy metal translocating P-type ATPase [Candidatus Uabimicrobium amorphum]|uniref:P-type Zn(2+) transporter n=1 Tax=Uabimicrobium amorphum TaxID=2596890 RepID=A0A5S9IS07_UABAM|nr:heavy metal translocating P-type ATPase [Candidatus Uabimicrobium amorphum]BBM87073.1 cadmium/zinc/cobalt-transporting ATPase [Candidatus Uabimicrobium amorphum]